jgi:quercetin dioxygenase-like cupin family protein
MTVAGYTKLAQFAITLVATGALGVPALAGDEHVLIEHDAFDYQAGPGSLSEGAEFQVLYGDPSGDGVFAMRLKLPDGFHIAPHHHGQPEIVTVISGTFRIGMGEEADPENTTALEPGGFFAYPPGMAHFAYAEGETVIQLNSTGPWTITYVDDQDDPRS